MNSLVMLYRQDIVFSLILGPLSAALRGTPIFIGLNPLKNYILPFGLADYEPD
jgi:hypothetical protein